MPVAETCPVCSRTKTARWVKQRDVQAVRCANCNEVMPFGRANERPVAVRLEMLAALIYCRHTSTYDLMSDQNIASGWDAHRIETVLKADVLVSDNPRWHAGWLAREIVSGDVTDKLDKLAQMTQDFGGYPELATGVPGSADPEVAALVREDDKRQVLVEHDGKFYIGTMRDGVCVVSIPAENPGTLTVSTAGQRGMGRLLAEMEVKSKEPWNPPDVFSGTPHDGEITGLHGIPGITEDDRTP